MSRKKGRGEDTFHILSQTRIANLSYALMREALHRRRDSLLHVIFHKLPFNRTYSITMIRIIADTVNFVNKSSCWNCIWKRENTAYTIYLFCEHLRHGKISENGLNASQGAGLRRWAFVSIWENKLRMLIFEPSDELVVSGPIVLWTVLSVENKSANIFGEQLMIAGMSSIPKYSAKFLMTRFALPSP
jgi:hypothetical protein